jgi:hypothetical protein
MSDGKKWTRRAAIGLIGGGVGLFSFNADAATQIYSDRGIDIGTESDDSALLPLNDESPGANISSPDDETAVYSIASSNINWDFTSVSIANITTEYGYNINLQDSLITASGSNGEVNISCSGSGFSGEYKFTFNLRAEDENGQVSVAAGRTTTKSIRINAISVIDYSDPNNYSDNDEGKANVPGDNAIGEVSSPENIGINNDDAATIEKPETGGGNEGTGPGGSRSLRVGFVLPSVQSANCYTLTVRTSDGTGNLRTYLAGPGDYELADSERKVKGGGNSGFDSNDEAEICDSDGEISSAGKLYLVFEGSGNQTHDIEFISFRPGCSSPGCS